MPICKNQYCFLILLLLGLGSCEDEVTIPTGALTPQGVVLAGSWKVSRVMQNGFDLSAQFDFKEVRLDLAMDGDAPTTYTLQRGKAPFPVASDGTWSYDDINYPTTIMFTDAQTAREIDFDKPPISTDKRFVLSFSLGCSDNIYTYEFIRQ